MDDTRLRLMEGARSLQDNDMWITRLTNAHMGESSAAQATENVAHSSDVKRPRLSTMGTDPNANADPVEGGPGNEQVEEVLPPIFAMPVEILHMVFGRMSYDQLAKIRLVSRTFNKEAGYLLTRGFTKFCDVLDRAKNTVKRELPRRESERRAHHLAKLNDVYSALDTRKALLELTYRKYVDSEVACFIPGKVLDEGFQVLNTLNRCKESGGVLTIDSCELLRDVRDLSSMAIEYFEDVMEPIFKEKMLSRSTQFPTWSPYSIRGRLTARLTDSSSTRTKSMDGGIYVPFATKVSVSLRSLPSWQKNIQEKMNEQDNVIRKQAGMIEGLRAALDMVTNVCERLVDYVDLPNMPIKFEEIRCLLRDCEEVEPKEEESPETATTRVVRNVMKRRAEQPIFDCDQPGPSSRI